MENHWKAAAYAVNVMQTMKGATLRKEQQKRQHEDATQGALKTLGTAENYLAKYSYVQQRQGRKRWRGRGGGNMQTNRDIVMQHANYLNIYELPAKPSQAELR